MRTGEIVRAGTGIARFVRIDEGNGSEEDTAHAVISDNGQEKPWYLPLSIVTVAELFEAAGHSVPEGARLFAHFLVGDGMTASDVRRYWGWRLITEVGHFLNGEWQVDKIDEANASDPIRVISAVSIDLSRLPAMDAWDALPEVIKAVVK